MWERGNAINPEERERFANGATTGDLMKLAMDMVGQREIPPDSAIYVPGSGIRKILFGIDMGVPEILVAKELGFDCVLAHHPDKGLMTFPGILDLHVPLMVQNGVPQAMADQAVRKMKEPYIFEKHSVNYDHAPSFARLLKMPYLNIHNPLDELGRRIMQDAIDSKTHADSTVGQVIDALGTIPELRDAPTKIELRIGSSQNKAGKTVVVHGAGTNGGASIAKLYYQAGVDTVVYIHIGYAHCLKLKEEFPEGKNLIITGHIASDLIGINPFIAKMESLGLEITRVSGSV